MPVNNFTYSGIIETAEASNTPVADDQENGGSISGVRQYIYITLPTTSKWFMITGIEWKNGTVVNGNVFAGIEFIDANPPVLANVLTGAFIQPIAQAGTNAVQRGSVVSSMPIRGGTTIAAWLVSDSATSKLRSLSAQPSINNKKTISGAVDYTNGNSTAWAAGTNYYYIKVYYRGIK